jgi:phytoene dehydrogenase-like protein
MTMTPDAIVVGSGPNGLAGAVTLARAGLSVEVLERSDYLGGGASTRELTIPNVYNDVCSAVHPMALASEFFSRFDLASRVEMLTPEISYAQPLDRQPGAIAYRDIARTAQELGKDGDAWLRLLDPLTKPGSGLGNVIGRELLRVPEHPITTARLGMRALVHGTPLWNLPFNTTRAAALLTGVFAHTIQTLPSIGTAAAGLALAAFGHSVGWPIPRGGSGAISAALVADLQAHGGILRTGVDVKRLTDIPRARIILLDVTPRGFLRLAGDLLPASFRRSMSRFRYGNGVAKVDFVLSEPVPWADPRLRSAVTVHVGGTRQDMARAEREVARGSHAEKPYVLTCQPTVLDETRAPAGMHVLWAYTHVPSGSTRHQLQTIIGQIERFAPGFRDTIVATASRTAHDMQQQNPNDVGGDIAAGDVSTFQLIARPRVARNEWSTPLRGVYLCSASTAPGPGVHGQCGWNAALRALRHEFGFTHSPSLALDPKAGA